MSVAAKLLRHHEGVRSTVYDDATGQPIVSGTRVRGHPTIGIGRNLERPLAVDEIEYLFTNDLALAERDARNYAASAWAFMSEARQAALIDMAFNMGLPTLRGFVQLRLALLRQDWNKAAAEMMDSAWGRSTLTRTRATTLSRIMQTGDLPEWAL